jgi:hypothetical protein
MKTKQDLAREDFYQKSFRVNLALQTALYLLDELHDNYLYKQRIKQLVNNFQAQTKQEIDRITGTLTKSENDNYATLAFEKYQEFKLIYIDFNNENA